MSYYTYHSGGREPLQYGLSLVTAPATEPITLADACSQCRQEVGIDDTRITSYIQTAREFVEELLGRRIVTQTWDLIIDRFPCGFTDMRCPWGPWQSITSIQYVDVNGTTQTFDSTKYNLDSASFEPRIYLSYAQVYPVSRAIQNAITIRHVSGYATVPERYKHMVRLLVEHYYDEARGVISALKMEKIPRGFDALIAIEKQSWV